MVLTVPHAFAPRTHATTERERNQAALAHGWCLFPDDDDDDGDEEDSGEHQSGRGLVAPAPGRS